MRDDTRKATTALVTLALLAIAWGAIPLFVRNDVPSTQLVGVRVTFGAIALIAVAAATRRLSFPKVRRGRLALSGVLLALHWITFFESIKLTTVAVALAVLYLGPIGAAILSGPILGERVDRRLWEDVPFLVELEWRPPVVHYGVTLCLVGRGVPVPRRSLL